MNTESERDVAFAWRERTISRIFTCTRYDPEGKGFVTHPDFVNHLTGLVFTPGDEAGTSHKIVEGSYRTLGRHHRDQQAKHEKITVAQANKSVTLSLRDVLQQLR